MTAQWPRVVVAALCGMCLLLTSAHADATWVLWVRIGVWEVSSREDRPVSTEWQQVELETFGSDPECRAAALREARFRFAKESRVRYAHPGSAEMAGAEVYVPLELGGYGDHLLPFGKMFGTAGTYRFYEGESQKVGGPGMQHADLERLKALIVFRYRARESE